MPVVDASVFSALFKADEPGHESSRSWLLDAMTGDEPIVSPMILLAEVASALGRGLRGCLKRSYCCETTDHKPDHCKADHRFACRGICLVILAQAAISA
ncbi:MAG: type II toxin-antitoxin system VapC family toxin [Acidimicrobiia bacterium]